MSIVPSLFKSKRHSLRARRAGSERGLEVQMEPRIELQIAYRRGNLQLAIDAHSRLGSDRFD